jgi:hypothetical protein
LYSKEFIGNLFKLPEGYKSLMGKGKLFIHNAQWDINKAILIPIVKPMELQENTFSVLKNLFF